MKLGKYFLIKQVPRVPRLRLLYSFPQRPIIVSEGEILSLYSLGILLVGALVRREGDALRHEVKHGERFAVGA